MPSPLLLVGKQISAISDVPSTGLTPLPLASIGVNGEAPAIDTEGNKRRRFQLLAITHFARSSVNFSK
jgi:hypothetical protein